MKTTPEKDQTDFKLLNYVAGQSSIIFIGMQKEPAPNDVKSHNAWHVRKMPGVQRSRWIWSIVRLRIHTDGQTKKQIY